MRALKLYLRGFTDPTGEAVDRRLLSGLVRMLGDLGLYGPTFSPLLLEETAAFYKQEGQRLIETADVPHYLAHCEVRPGSVYARVRQGRGCHSVVRFVAFATAVLASTEAANMKSGAAIQTPLMG